MRIGGRWERQTDHSDGATRQSEGVAPRLLSPSECRTRWPNPTLHRMLRASAMPGLPVSPVDAIPTLFGYDYGNATSNTHGPEIISDAGCVSSPSRNFHSISSIVM